MKYLVLVLILVAGFGFGRVVIPKHWEYRICFLGDPHTACDLNALGARGWELVTATPHIWKDGTVSAQVFLRREIP